MAFPLDRRLIAAVLLVGAAAVLLGGRRAAQYIELGAAYTAKLACSGVFVSHRPLDEVLAGIAIDDLSFLRRIHASADSGARTVTAAALGVVRRTAAYRDGVGCGLGAEPDSTPDAVTGAPRSALEAAPDPRVQAVLERAFVEPDPDALRRTQAVVVVLGGRIVGEGYAPGISAETPLPGWSMTKSVLHALVGILAGQGRLDLHAPAPVVEWRDDARATITLEQLLRMSSGLHFDERYDSPGSDVLRMLFDERDAAGFAAAKELEAEPGARWEYSSGTSNIVAGILRDAIGDDSAYRAFPRAVLFDRIGMTDAVLETDADGTFVASSYMYATARDWARFGLLYLRDGVWEGERILPEGWVSHARLPAPADTAARFGAHFWLRIPDSFCASGTPLPADAFHAVGHEAQFVTIVPSRDIVIVRLGRARHPHAWDQCEFARGILDALGRPPAPASRSPRSRRVARARTT